MRIEKPITSQEASEGGFKPWPPGEYDFEVLDASDEISQRTNAEMIKLTLQVFNREGKTRKVFDYLVSIASMQFKVRHFAEATGMVAQYEAGEMDIHDIVNRSGRLKLRIKPAQGNYQEGNEVQDYIPAPMAEARPAARPQPARQPVMAGGSTANDLNDDIPFAASWR